MQKHELPVVTVGVIAYNEEKYLPVLLSCLRKQTYPLSQIEVVLVNSASTDNTKQIMMDFEKDARDVFFSSFVYDNPKKTQPSGWNVVIQNMTGDILIRIDAHAIIPENFIDENVKCLESGEYVCGGPRTNVIDDNTAWKRTLLTAEQSMFGSGIAPYRRQASVRYVKSVFHAAYRKEVIDKVGLFNETLLRTEDNEYHYRVREAGYKICYDENIQSYYQTRNTLTRMIKQKYGNGFWIGKTLYTCPKCLSSYHFVPALFVICLLLSAIMKYVFCIGILLKLILVLYELVCVILSFISWIKDNFLITDIALLVIFPLLHISYGIGTIFGIFDGKNKKG